MKMSKSGISSLSSCFGADRWWRGSGEKPVEDVSGKRHPNLAAAQRLSQQANEKVTAAQQANEWDMVSGAFGFLLRWP